MAGVGAVRVEEADLLGRLDEVHAESGRIDRLRLRAIMEADRAGAWSGQGHRDHASLLAARYGYSVWKARRLIAAACAIEHLPLTSHALEHGRIGLDNVIELTRFATAADEDELLGWASRVSTTAVRRRADLASRERDKARETLESRFLTWWWEEGGTALCLEGRLPADDGERFIAAVERLAKDLPAEPPDENAHIHDEDDTIDRRRADALVLLTTSTEGGRERSTVVVHAPLESLLSENGDAEIAGGQVVSAATARRIACDSKVEMVLYGDDDVVGIGRVAHDPPQWLRRQVLKRDDHTCAFPGCDLRRYLHVHHIEWWIEGGHTNLDNLVTVCHFHHKLVHEYGWRVHLRPDGRTSWLRPGGVPHEPDRAPPRRPNLTANSVPWGSLWHALKTADLEATDGFFLRWSPTRGTDWVPAEGNTTN